MFHTTEYASKFVWHENAYMKRPLQICRHSFNLSDEECESRLPLPFPFRRGNENQQRPKPMEGSRLLLGGQKENQDEILSKLVRASSSCCLHKECLSPLRIYPEMEGDSRGLKSHFLPASIDVLLDLGLSCRSSRRNSGSETGSNEGDQSCERSRASSQNNNQYFTSVYKRDFAKQLH